MVIQNPGSFYSLYHLYYIFVRVSHKLLCIQPAKTLKVRNIMQDICGKAWKWSSTLRETFHGPELDFMVSVQLQGRLLNIIPSAQKRKGNWWASRQFLLQMQPRRRLSSISQGTSPRVQSQRESRLSPSLFDSPLVSGISRFEKRYICF